jgi:hypothetical protein
MSLSKLRSSGNRAQAWSEIGQSISVHAIRVPEQSSYQQHVNPINPRREGGGVGGDGGAGMGELVSPVHRRGQTLRPSSWVRRGVTVAEPRTFVPTSSQYMAFGNPNSAIVKTAIQTQSGNRFTHAEWGFLSPLFPLSQTFWVSPLGRIFASCQWTQLPNQTRPNSQSGI